MTNFFSLFFAFAPPRFSLFFFLKWKKNVRCDISKDFIVFLTLTKLCEGGYFRSLHVALSSLRKYWINEVTSEVVRVLFLLLLLLLDESLIFRRRWRRCGQFLSMLRFEENVCRDGKDVERLVRWELVRSIWTVRVVCWLVLILLFLG